VALTLYLELRGIADDINWRLDPGICKAWN